MPQSFTQAMILAAGQATRLRPLSTTIPKAALPVMNRPLVHYVLDWLRRYGVVDVAVNLYHLPEVVRQAVESYGHPEVRVRFSLEEGRILRTAGALAPLRDFFRRGGTFVLVNGKIVTDIDLSAALACHRRSGALATLVVVPNRTSEPFTHVQVDGDGVITGYSSYEEARRSGRQPMVFTGIHLLEGEVLDFIPDGRPYDTVADLYPDLVRRGAGVRAFVAEGDWLEFSTLSRYLRHSLVLLGRTGRTLLSGPGFAAASSAVCRGVVAGAGVGLDVGAAVSDSVLLGENRIGRDARVERCILAPRAEVPAGVSLRGRIVMPPDGGDPAPGSERLANGAVASALGSGVNITEG